MAFTQVGGRYYAAPERASRAEITPHIRTADGQSSSFLAEDAFQLIATLGAHSYKRIDPTGANNSFDIIARTPGDQSALTFEVATPAGSTIVVDKTSNAITVTPGTTSTAAQVIAAINASTSEAHQYVYAVANGTVTGTLAAVAQGALSSVSGGTTPTMDVTLQGSWDGSTWFNIAAFTQLTDVLGSEKKGFTNLATYLRWDYNIAGTGTPTYALSITADARYSRT